MHRRSARLLAWGLAAIAAAAVTAGCTQERAIPPGAPQEEVAVDRGRRLLIEYGCGTCHTIPGVRGADGLVGPPLNNFSQRTFIAGQLPNNPENLARWIQDPQEVEPGTAMPDLGVSAEEARNMAAYLHSLE